MFLLLTYVFNLRLIIIFYRISLLILIKITSSGLSGVSSTFATDTPEGAKGHKNVSNKCWLREEITIVKECHSCSNRPECINTRFVETIECKNSGLTYRTYVHSLTHSHKFNILRDYNKLS